MLKTMQLVTLVVLLCIQTGCDQANQNQQNTEADKPVVVGQSGVQDDISNPNVVQIAMSSPDHSTLVAAVAAGGLVDALSNVGPFTVFAPVNSAFDALPAGTVESLLKPENKRNLVDILEYHVYVGVIRSHMISDGMVLNQVNGKNITLKKDGDNITVNGAPIQGSINASNGIIYIIDKVLLPE
jgi:uncharacterized surface protein with fasciclin (FAS1) repeats